MGAGQRGEVGRGRDRSRAEPLTTDKKAQGIGMSKVEEIVKPLRGLLFLWQVVFLFVLAAWILSALIRGSSLNLALPPWVVVAALILLVAYLPVALVIAYKREAAEKTVAGPEKHDGAVRPRDVFFSRRNLISLLLFAATFAMLMLASQFIVQSGLVISIVAVILLGVLLVDCWRRLGRFPHISYAGNVLSQPETRRLWAAFLMISFGVALEAFGTSYQGYSYEWRDESQPLHMPDGALSWSRSYELPFLKYEIREEQTPQGTYSGSVTQESSIPWVFFLAAVLYWLMVMRWPQTVWEPEQEAFDSA